ncbi:Superfamily II DNA/RNA helicase SNF2 family [Methanonatronarchaeum thermophilum]|uniref:Superfamily II DNA/RNA helicase SNF2 family n=1 Tax=Methanonatronarchaeum thermophilum TaxID=1927129 RepID=A0A1Y3GFS4_9EURY|nr:helicase-related protein [Methanonatronarchaeum thermophilum]OUJ18305.1 Superfamily II DNA/RNA helicase SNF2 family [Methanonatronarchaeum thermophilum]
MVVLNVGDRVKFAGGKGEVTKIEERPNGNHLLHVYTDEGQLRKLPSGLPHIEKMDSVVDRLKACEVDSPVHCDLRERATRLDLAYRYDRFLSLTSNRIEIEPYQVKAAYEILNSYDKRYLIGDEVGLGKTIEAGIVIEELIARGRADRVLIVAPAPLTFQWQKELREKFNRNFVIYDRQHVETCRRSHPTKNVWEQENFIITSIDFLKQTNDDPDSDILSVRDELENLEPGWDIAIFDEAHHLTARRGSDQSIERTQRYKAAEIVARNSDSLLLLTGTPHKGKQDQFYFLIKLLDPYRFSHESEITPEKLDDLMIRRLKEDMYETDGTRMFPDKNIEAIPVRMSEAEKQLYKDVTEYTREYYNLAKQEDKNVAGFTMVIYQKRAVSSIHAIKKSLENRIEAIQSDSITEDLPKNTKELLRKYATNPETLTDSERTQVEKALETVTFKWDKNQMQKELEQVKKLLKQAQNIEKDSKEQLLRKIIDRILYEDPEEKILIFTDYTDTLKYLRDQVLQDHDVAEVYGDLNQQQRIKEMKKFEEEANIMLATDAAQEGLNLQFAHIMINYDLPWNPIRIDQRMGRLHRYGQTNTVEIRNLFYKDTRENEILKLLLDKIDQIESDLGMSSDVMGQILDEVDLEKTIMTAIAEDKPTKEVIADIEKTMKEQKDALETVEKNFLIRDHFDLSNEDEELLEVIERSQTEEVTEEDIEKLVRNFFNEFNGEIKGTRPGPSRSTGDIYQLKTPNIISGQQIKQKYPKATFTKDIAMKKDDIEFIAIDHPIVKSIIDLSTKSDHIKGQIAIKTTENNQKTPGILFTYRLGYTSGAGEIVTEKMKKIYVNKKGEVTTNPPKIKETLSPQNIESKENIQELASKAKKLHQEAEMEAWNQVESFAEEARKERKREIEIKKQHAEKHFKNEIQTWQKRLKKYQKKAEKGEDMSAPIGNAKTQIKNLKDEKKDELEYLEEEKHVIPEEPELTTTAYVISEK